MLSTTAAQRAVKESFASTVGSRAGFRTATALHRQGLRDLVKRARAFDRIERAARADDLNGNDLAEIVYHEVGKTTGVEIP